MVLRISIISFLLVFTSCKPSSKKCIACEAEQAVSGLSLYTYKCESCHGPKGDLGVSGARDLSKSKLREEEIREILMEGKGAMPPALELVEEPSHMDSVVKYVQKLRK